MGKLRQGEKNTYLELTHQRDGLRDSQTGQSGLAKSVCKDWDGTSAGGFKAKFQRINSFIILPIFTSLLEAITFQTFYTQEGDYCFIRPKFP